MAKIGARLGIQETREVINSLAAIINEALVIDLDAVNEGMLLEALNSYRMQRGKARIIIYAQGRVPGDRTLAMLRAMSIHDILAPENAPSDMVEYIIEVLQSVPADYAASARWGIGQQTAPQQRPRKTLFGNINVNLSFGHKTSGGILCMPHQLVAVWSPDGFAGQRVPISSARQL